MMKTKATKAREAAAAEDDRMTHEHERSRLRAQREALSTQLDNSTQATDAMRADLHLMRGDLSESLAAVKAIPRCICTQANAEVKSVPFGTEPSSVPVRVPRMPARARPAAKPRAARKPKAS
jgi:hypothetical protein